MGKGKWSVCKHEWKSAVKDIVVKLDEEQINYAVGGEYALRFHGYPLVMNYLEILVNANDLNKVAALFGGQVQKELVKVEVNDLDVQFCPFSLPTSCCANGVKVADLLTLVTSLLKASEQAKNELHEILLRSHVEEVAIANHLEVNFAQNLPLQLQHRYKSIFDKASLPTISFEESSLDEEYVYY